MGDAGKRYVYPARSVLNENSRPFRPMAEEKTINLCEDIPLRRTTEPLRLCFQGVGDVRNVLFNVYKRRMLGDKRTVEIVINDSDPVIIAKDVLLLSLVEKTPLVRRDLTALADFTEFFTSLWFDLMLSPAHRSRLSDLLGELISNFPEKMKFLQPGDKKKVIKIWSMWKDCRMTANEAMTRREATIRWDRAQPYYKDDWVLRKDTYMSDRDIKIIAEGRLRMDAISMRDFAPTPQMREETKEYLKSGSRLRPGKEGVELSLELTKVNPTVIDLVKKRYPYYQCNPLHAFLMAAEEVDFCGDNQSLFYTINMSVQRLAIVFANELALDRVNLTFDIGDCESLVVDRLPSHLTFDVIDTSCLSDVKGVLPLLLLNSARLNRNECHSTLWIHSLRSHRACISMGAYLKDILPAPYSVWPTLFQLTCSLPFESGLSFDERRGYKSMPTVYTQLMMKWKVASPQTMLIDLVPGAVDCVFKKMIDELITNLFWIFTGRVRILRINDVLHPQYRLTISTILHLLLSLARMLSRPKDIFTHFYGKVQAIDAKSRVRFGKIEFGAFALDVQTTAKCVLPAEYQPDSPLHHFFKEGSGEVQTYVYQLRENGEEKAQICPLGFVLVEDLTLADVAVLEGGNLHNCTSFGHAHDWLFTNSHRIQIIDNAAVDTDTNLLKITLPRSAVTRSRFHIIGMDMQKGTVIFSPFRESDLAELTDYPKSVRIPSCIPSVPTVKRQSDLFTVTSLFEYGDRYEVHMVGEQLLSGRSQLVFAQEKKTCLVMSVASEKTILHKKKKKKKEETKVDTRASGLLHFPGLVNATNCQSLIIGEYSAILVAFKPTESCEPVWEKLDLDKLSTWPLHRPVGIGHSLYTMIESETSRTAARGLGYGHDSYVDVRQTISAMFQSFIDMNAMDVRRVVKMKQDGHMIFHFVSSFAKGFAAYCPSLLLTPLGTPIIEVYYGIFTRPLSQECEKLILHIENIPKKWIHDTRGLDEEMDFLFNFLNQNGQMLVNAEPRLMAGTEMKRSFVYPLYPLEDRLGRKVPIPQNSYPPELIRMALEEKESGTDPKKVAAARQILLKQRPGTFDGWLFDISAKFRALKAKPQATTKAK
ncbi:uncharacterized protein LOC134180357 [Corticium candelabrum]|uniref:uncharacterized protein LOC134180357 n=1 Tax=Corticium candelabrum TaxID=121492 RepID=UPI002E274E83|nr:uncharacterized protein LOC134180357 [Corticium candelabrum]